MLFPLNKISVLILFVILTLGLNSCGTNDKIFYVTTNKLFESYKGTKELNNKLVTQENRFKILLDSIKLEIEICRSRNNSKEECLSIENDYKEVYNRMVQFNNEYVTIEKEKIWHQLNSHIEVYGRENNFKYILGANGTGSIMYADSTYDITEEVLVFANLKYDGK